MKGPLSRIARITVYVVAPEIPFTPPAEAAAGVVTKTSMLAKGPVTRRASRIREDAQKLRMTRIRVGRKPPASEPPTT